MNLSMDIHRIERVDIQPKHWHAGSDNEYWSATYRFTDTAGQELELTIYNKQHPNEITTIHETVECWS